jgi:hypothetical protein
MKLQHFQTLTSRVPAQKLRNAMVLALAAEATRTPSGYLRFYCRVFRELRLALAGDCDGIDDKAQSVAT